MTLPSCPRPRRARQLGAAPAPRLSQVRMTGAERARLQAAAEGVAKALDELPGGYAACAARAVAKVRAADAKLQAARAEVRDRIGASLEDAYERDGVEAAESAARPDLDLIEELSSPPILESAVDVGEALAEDAREQARDLRKRFRK